MASLSTFAMDPARETAVLGGGCFWCIESDFEKLEGVTDVMSGYAGGDRPDPTYETYNKTTAEYPTPHVEVVRVEFDPAIIGFEEILNYYYRHIDPTDGGGQFCDRGPGYRPVIFVQNQRQHAIAQTVTTAVSAKLGRDVNVDILDESRFYSAEDYHQDYARKNPVRYKFYRWNCGRDQRIQEIWGGK